MSEVKYLSAKQYADLHNLDRSLICRYIRNGRISAIKIGNQWAIPKDEPRPCDKRIKSGKYRKAK